MATRRRGRTAVEPDVGVALAADLPEAELLIEDQGDELPGLLDVGDLAPDPGVDVPGEVDPGRRFEAAEIRFEARRLDGDDAVGEVDADLDGAAEGEEVPPPLEGRVAELDLGRELAVGDAERRPRRGPDRPGDLDLPE